MTQRKKYNGAMFILNELRGPVTRLTIGVASLLVGIARLIALPFCFPVQPTGFIPAWLVAVALFASGIGIIVTSRYCKPLHCLAKLATLLCAAVWGALSAGYIYSSAVVMSLTFVVLLLWSLTMKEC